MAGEARTNNFMLGTATVMIGPLADLYNLNPQDHSLGLVKNFTITGQPEQTTLGQGIANDEIFAVTTSNPTRGSWEMYEYTEKNLAYALGLDGASLADITGEAFETGSEVSFSGGSATLPILDATGQDVSVGNVVSLRDPSTDNITLAKVTSVSGISGGVASGGSATITVSIPDGAGTLTIAAGTKVSVVNVLDLGRTDVNKDYAAKVTGQLANGKWVTVYLPKFRVTSGLSMAFATDNFGNMPFEISPRKLIPTDMFYAEYKGKVGHFALDSVTAPLS